MTMMTKLSIDIPSGQAKPATDAILAELKRIVRMPPAPVPEKDLDLLYQAACGDTGGSQAARGFLFWLAGQPDPTGFIGDGGLELRRMDHRLKNAALEVLAWWAGPTKSDNPLYDLLAKLRSRFRPPASGRAGGRSRGEPAV
jgi:hypothetical protein